MKLLTDPTALSAHAEDYGRLVRPAPMIVALPNSTEDVQHALDTARRQSLKVRARSGGHGLEGQALVENGMVIATTDLVLSSGARIELAGAGGVRVVPSVKTGEVERFLAGRGLRLPSMTMDGFPAMGGAVATAGIGQGSHRYGSLADQVLELEAVLGTGEIIHSTGEDDIGRFLRGGLGYGGILTSLTFPVVPIRGTLRAFRTFHGSLAETAHALAATADDVVATWGAVIKSPKSASLAFMTTIVRDVEDPNIGIPMTSAGDPGADPAVVPAWLDVIFPSLGHAVRALDAHPELLTNLLETPGMVLLIPQRKVCEDRPTLNAWPNARIGEQMLALGVFYYLDRARAADAVKALARIRAEVIQAHDAMPYYMDGVPSDWQIALGPTRYAAVAEILAKADPDGLLGRLTT